MLALKLRIASLCRRAHTSPRYHESCAAFTRLASKKGFTVQRDTTKLNADLRYQYPSWGPAGPS